MHDKRSRAPALPFRITAIAAALLALFSSMAEAGQLIANGSTLSADGDYSTTGTGSAGYALWASNNGRINSTGASSLSISAAQSSAIVAQSGGQITLGGDGLGRFNVTSGGNGVTAIQIAGTANSPSLVSLSGADIDINLGTLAGTGNAYGVSLAGNATLNLDNSTLRVSAGTRGSNSNVFGINTSGSNNRISLNNVNLTVAGSTSTGFSESTFGISLSNATLTGDNVAISLTSASNNNGKTVLSLGSGAQATLSNIRFTGSGPLVGGVSVLAAGSVATLDTGSISVNGPAGVYNANVGGTINAYNIDATSTASNNPQTASSANNSLLNLVGGSVTATGTSANVLTVSQSTARLQDTRLTMNYGSVNSSFGYLMRVDRNGLIDANHITATGQNIGAGAMATGIYALSGGQVKLYNGSRIDLNGYTVTQAGSPVPSYGALISGTGSALTASDSTIAVNAPRDGVVGVQTQNGGSATLTNMTISTAGAASNSHGLVNMDAASSMTVNGGSVSTGGGVSYAINARGGSLITLNGSALKTSGTASSAVAAMDGSTVRLTGGSIDTSGRQAFGIYQQDNLSTPDTVIADGTRITTTGNFAAGVFNRFGNTVSLSNATIDTSGTEAFGIVSSIASGTVAGGVPRTTADNTSVTTHGSGAHAAVVHDGGTLTVRNHSTLTAQGAGASALSAGVGANALGGSDASAANKIGISDSALVSASSAAIAITGKNNELTLADSTVTGGSGLALSVQSGMQDGFQYAGHLTLAAANSTLNGAITTASDGSTNNVTLNGGSLWNVAGNSNLTHLTLDDATVRFSAAANLTAGVTLGSGGAVIDTNGHNAVYNGAIDGSGSMAKNGLGTLTLTGASALGYAGATFINNGVLALRGWSAVDASALDKTFTLNGGWLDLSDTAWTGSDASANDWAHLVIASGANAAAGGIIGSNDKVTYDIAAGRTESIDYQIGKIDGNKNGLYLVKGGEGTLILDHANEYKGYTRIDGGVLRITADDNLGDTALAREVILNGGKLQISADLTSRRALELRQSGSMIVDGGVSAAWNGGIVESGGAYDFTKTGGGTLVLGGIASQSGATIVEAGTLQAGAANLFSANDSMRIALGATVDLQNHDQRINHLSGGGELRLGSASATLNNVRDTQFDGLISGSGNLIKSGDGELTLSRANTYTGDTLIAAGALRATGNDIVAASRSLTVDSVFDLNDSAQHVNRLSGSGEVRLGNGELFAHNDVNTVFAGVIGGSGSVEKTGDATLTLTGGNAYSGGTTVSAGTLGAGAVNTFSASSSVTVAVGGTLDLAGFSQTVAGLANAGTVSLGTNTPPGTVLTVAGDYAGHGGAVLLNTHLGDDDSPTDRLVVQGNTSGSSRLVITNAGGLGALTTGNGIKVVEVHGDSAGEFVLGDRVAAGLYEYTLNQGGLRATDGNWYLRNEVLVPSDDPSGFTAVPDVRPEVPLASAMLPLATEYGYALLDTLHERVGELWGNGVSAASERPNAAWVRVLGNRGSHDGADRNDARDFFRNGPQYDYTVEGIQSGVNLYDRESADGTLDRAGLYLGLGRISADVDDIFRNKAGSIDMDAYSLGAYWTHRSPDRWYTDAVLQGTYYSADAHSVEGQHVKPNGWGVLASLEGGYAVPLNERVTLEPQAQMIYQRISLDNTRDAYGVFRFDEDDSLRGRLGLRLSRSWASDVGGTQRPGSAWIRANVWHEFQGDSKTTVGTLDGAGDKASVTSSLGGSWGEIGVGVAGPIGKQVNLFGTGSYSHSIDGNGREGWGLRLGVSWQF